MVEWNTWYLKRQSGVGKGLPEKVIFVGRMHRHQPGEEGGLSILDRELSVCEFQVVRKKRT